MFLMSTKGGYEFDDELNFSNQYSKRKGFQD